MASYCETCGNVFDGEWTNCPECGDVARGITKVNDINTPKDKNKKTSTKKTVPNAGERLTGTILREIQLTLEHLDRKNLSEMNEHLWWLALGVKLGLFMMLISIFLMLVSLA